MKIIYRSTQAPRIGASPLCSPKFAFLARVALLCGLCLAGLAQPILAQRVASAQTAPASTSASPPTPSPDICRVGAFVTGLTDFDLVKKSFQIDFWMWAVSPNRPGPLKTLELVNARDAKAMYDQVVVKTDPYHNFGADRKVFWSQRRFTGTIRAAWNEVNYPLDRHVLLIEMEDLQNDSGSIVYLPDAVNTRISKDVKLEGWKVTDVSFTERKNVYNTTFGDPTLKDGTSEHSRLVLAISIEREKRTNFWKLTAGVYAAFVLSLLGFFYDPDQPTLMSARSSIIVGSLFAAVVNMRAIEGVLGHTENLTLIDNIHILTIFYIFTAALAAIASRLLCEKGRKKTAMHLDRAILFPTFLVTYILCNAFLIWLASFVG